MPPPQTVLSSSLLIVKMELSSLFLKMFKLAVPETEILFAGRTAATTFSMFSLEPIFEATSGMGSIA